MGPRGGKSVSSSIFRGFAALLPHRFLLSDIPTLTREATGHRRNYLQPIHEHSEAAVATIPVRAGNLARRIVIRNAMDPHRTHRRIARRLTRTCIILGICSYCSMKQRKPGRPHCPRRIACSLEHRIFKPAGIPSSLLEFITLSMDEVEALRLADVEGKYHDEAAAAMGVSRATFGRIVASARGKSARALIEGKALRMEGGSVMYEHPQDPGSGGHCICVHCGERQPHAPGVPCKESRCPQCGKHMLREGSGHHQAWLRNNQQQGDQS